MSVPATEAVTAGMFGAMSNSATERAANEADKDMFLQLLVAQMKYQDPMNPTDSSQFLAQSAQFTALEKMQEVADQTAQLVSAQIAFGASGLIGREVTWMDPETGMSTSGIVQGVNFSSAEPTLQVEGGHQLSMGEVSAVAASTTSAATPTPQD